MKLYDIQGDKVVIHADLLGLPKMKELYEANPEVGYKEISYIVLKNVVDSPYDGQYEEEKARLISRQLFGTTDWRPSKGVIEAEAQFVEYYYDNLLARLLRGVKRRLEKVSRFYEESLYEELDDTVANKFIDTVGKLEKMITSVEALEKSVKAKESVGTKVKGGAKINPYESSNR